MRGLIGKTLFGACELILGRGGNGEKLKRRFLHSHASDDFGNFRVQIVPIAQLQVDVKPIALCVFQVGFDSQRAITYYQRYCDERGRERQFKIGRGDILTAEQARRAARSILARAVLGENPQMRRQEMRSIPSLAEFVAEKYLPFVKTYKRSWGTDETVLASMSCPRSGKWRSMRSRPSISSR